MDPHGPRPDEDVARTPNRLPALALAALVVAVVPFFVQARTTSSVRVDGVMTSATSLDIVALVAGALAVMGAVVVLLVLARRGVGARPALAWGVGLVALALGTYHVANGLGAFTSTTPATPERVEAPRAAPSAPPTPAWVCDNDRLEGCVTGCEKDGDAVACGKASAYLGGLGDREPDFARARAFARRACDLGDAVGCGNMGAFYLNGQGGPKDPHLASRFFATACKAGVADRCIISLRLEAEQIGAVGDAVVGERLALGCAGADRHGCFQSAHDLEATGLVPLAAQVFAWLCERGHAGACNERGRLYNAAEGDARDRAAADLLFDKSCEGGDAVGCINRALNALNEDPPDARTARARLTAGCAGPGAKRCLEVAPSRRSRVEAVALARAACDGGQVAGCRVAGLAILESSPKEAERAEAIALYERACDGGDLLGCRFLGGYHLGEHGARVDVDAAWRWLSRACAESDDGGSPCGSLARDLAAAGRPVLARRVAVQGCEVVGEGDACALAPFMTPSGEVDAETVVAFSRRGCELASALACKNMAVALLDGSYGVAQDIPRALELLETACGHGNADACVELASTWEEGRHGVEANAVTAGRFNQRACEVGVTQRCDPRPAAPTE